MSKEEWDKVSHKYSLKEGEGLNKEEALRDLKDIKKVLDEEGVTFWLTFGTLLGAIRDKDFISIDDDVDLLVRHEDLLPKFKILKEKFIDLGFIVRNAYKKVGIKMNLYRYSQKNSIEGVVLKGKYLVSKSFRHPSKFFEELETVKFKDIEVRVPSPPEGYLSFLYNDWKTPIKAKDLDKDHKWRNKKARIKKGKWKNDR